MTESSRQDSPAYNPENTIRLLTRAHVQQWTPTTIQQAPLEAVLSALSMVDNDQPQYTRRIAPPGMPLENFHNMLLREMDRRQAFGQYILSSTVPPRPGEENRLVSNDALDDVLRFIRPQLSMNGGTVSTGERREQNVTPADAALYDAAVTSLLFERYQTTNPQNGATINPTLVLDRDVVTALNLPPASNGNVYASKPLTDVGRRTLGYAFGSVDAFNPLHSEGPLLVTLTPGITFGEMQPAYCRIVHDMYEAGDQQNPRDSFTTGFIQGRVNDRNPEATDPAIGITGPCPTPPRPQASAAPQR